MSAVHYLHYDMWIRATYRLMDWVVECTAVWDEMPSYRRDGKLTYFAQLGSNLSMLRAAESLGKLSLKQIRGLRNLERLAVEARGTVKILQERHDAIKARERRDGR
jgi:hypothetical protein